MLLELKFSIGTVGLAAGTLVSALYGMNLKNFIEESDLGFGSVTGMCFATAGIVCVYGLLKLRKVQRVRMWGEGGIHDPYAGALGIRGPSPLTGRGNWRSDTLDPTWANLPAEGRANRLRRLRAGSTASSTAAAMASRSAGQGKRGDRASSPMNFPHPDLRSPHDDHAKEWLRDCAIPKEKKDNDEFEQAASASAAFGSSR